MHDYLGQGDQKRKEQSPITKKGKEQEEKDGFPDGTRDDIVLARLKYQFGTA